MELRKKLLFLKENPDSYIMFLPPDMGCLKAFRKELKYSLKQHSFEENDISQIVLAADEALTNSISANLSNNSLENIICRWKIRETKFTLVVMDYGKGIKLNQDISNCSDCEKADLIQYIEKIKKHQEKKSGILPFSGIPKIHRNMGHGLKIIKKLMDTVRVLYHCNGEISENLQEDNVSGSILEIEFTAKKN